MERNTLRERAFELLQKAIVTKDGLPIGTVAACDTEVSALNYDQVFTRDFAVSAMAFLMKGETDMVRNFLTACVELQACAKTVDCFSPGEGLMPASFKVDESGDPQALIGDFGQHAIARVAPVDSGFWWLVVLRAYVKATGDVALAHQPSFQRSIRRILDLCLTVRFDMFPSLLVPDGSFMIDRRMAVYGYPIDIQVLFFAALRAAKELLKPDEPLIESVALRLGHLMQHVRDHYWLNADRVNAMYRYEVEEFGTQAMNRFNLYPETMPSWLFDWIPDDGGYLAGNLGPGRIDYRFFTQGNLLSIPVSMVDDDQAMGIMNLVEAHWDILVGRMPIKVAYPALEGRDWEVLTGSDPKNTPWSYHNGGSWPFLLWTLGAAAIKTQREDLLERALGIAETRLDGDSWPEYYDGINNRLIGKKSRKFQTWTIAGYIAACELLERPEHLDLILFQEDDIVYQCACDAREKMDDMDKERAPTSG